MDQCTPVHTSAAGALLPLAPRWDFCTLVLPLLVLGPALLRHRTGMAPASLQHRTATTPASLRHRSGIPLAPHRHRSGTTPASHQYHSGTAPAPHQHRSGTAPAPLSPWATPALQGQQHPKAHLGASPQRKRGPRCWPSCCRCTKRGIAGFRQDPCIPRNSTKTFPNIKTLKNAIGSDITTHGYDEDYMMKNTNRTSIVGFTLLNKVTHRHREDTVGFSTHFSQTPCAALCTNASTACGVRVTCATPGDLPCSYIVQVQLATEVPPPEKEATSMEQRLQLGSRVPATLLPKGTGKHGIGLGHCSARS